METLTKRKRGKPRKYDFSNLLPGETIPLIGGRKVKKNPVAYITYWNKTNPAQQVEVLVDEKGNPFIKLV